MRLGHFRIVIPHGGGNFGERAIAQPVFQRQRSFVTIRAAFFFEQLLAAHTGRQRESQLGAARRLPFIEANTADWLPTELRTGLTTLHDDIVSLGDFDTHLSDKLQFLLDATLGFINIAQNDVIKVLTIASVVGIPPVLIAGVYGMNFKNMPEYDWTYGYQFGWAVIILTALIPLAIFRWRKWI